ncbi:MAG: putative lipid II flippase FtsW [Candidatus Omnitrophica bacterium]|nr:putative lipid II flippase FtsW [Candidatus Omnitrophota bacterium]MCM8803418.1 putative lipid II flippase FtsW [Candidatus Omnitrophota bacterium]
MFSKKKYFLYVSILISTFLLIFLGTVFVLSSSFFYGLEKNNLTMYFEKHIIYLVIGLVMLYLIQKSDIKKLEKYGFIILVISLAILPIPIFQKGLRWIKVGPFSFQPSEFVKLSFIIYLATYFKKRFFQINNLKVLTSPLIIYFLIITILQFQKDYGIFLIISITFLSVLFLCGLKLKYILGVLGVFIALSILFILLFPYRIERIIAFINQNSDVLGKNYQTKQAIISLSSGGLFGKGLGAGTGKLKFVPEIHKDFVYAVVGEELGFVGSFGILLLFGIIVFCGLELSKFCDDLFNKILVSGISISFGTQFLLHAGVVLSILPPKGTTLPFFSVGGSSLIVSLISLGILLKIAESITKQGNLKEIEEIILKIK